MAPVALVAVWRWTRPAKVCSALVGRVVEVRPEKDCVRGGKQTDKLPRSVHRNVQTIRSRRVLVSTVNKKPMGIDESRLVKWYQGLDRNPEKISHPRRREEGHVLTQGEPNPTQPNPRVVRRRSSSSSSSSGNGNGKTDGEKYHASNSTATNPDATNPDATTRVFTIPIPTPIAIDRAIASSSTKPRGVVRLDARGRRTSVNPSTTGSREKGKGSRSPSPSLGKTSSSSRVFPLPPFSLPLPLPQDRRWSSARISTRWESPHRRVAVDVTVVTFFSSHSHSHSHSRSRSPSPSHRTHHRRLFRVRVCRGGHPVEPGRPAGTPTSFHHSSSAIRSFVLLLFRGIGFVVAVVCVTLVDTLNWCTL